MSITYASIPKPEQVAEAIVKTMAIQAPDMPCALSVDGQSAATNDAGRKETYFIGHVPYDKSTAWAAMKPRDLVRLAPENAKGGFTCANPGWILISPTITRAWHAWARDYHGTWDGSKLDEFAAEKKCTDAADLYLTSGETFPDMSEALQAGVRLPSMSSQTIKWRSFALYNDSKNWFSCTVNANDEPKIVWDRPRDD